MDFRSLKSVSNLKTLLQKTGKDIVEAFKSVREVDFNKFKSGFNTYFVEYLKNSYAQFDGRVSRRQYWMFALYSILIGVALRILIMIFQPLAVLGLLYNLALLVPSIGLGVRRLHDINLSGWFFLISFIPFIGGLALVLLFCLSGDGKANDYENKF